MLHPRTAAAVAAMLVGCAQLEGPNQPDFAKASSGPSVAAADPPFGRRGDVGLAVTITGSGFDQGSRASWERNGVADLKITVRSSQYLSSTQLVATIDIATDATLSLYDVAVTTAAGRKGIGTARFEVTQAQLLPGTESAFGANESGEIVGRVGVPGPFYYSSATGVVTLGKPGRAFDLAEDGRTVVGFTGVCCDGAFVFENIGGSWQYTMMPKDPAASYHVARGVGSDPVTGAVQYVAGHEAYSLKAQTIRQPRLWAPGPGGWTRIVLPALSTADSPVFDANGSGAAVGAVGGMASAWLPNGAGGWSVATFGSAGSQALAIDAAGSVAVGYAPASGNTTAAQYWTLSGAVWTSRGLPGGCTEAVDIDNTGRILVNGCPNGNRRTPAVISPPYGAADVRLLGGLGDANGTTTASRMSAAGTWIAGSAPYKSQSVGVRWTLGVP